MFEKGMIVAPGRFEGLFFWDIWAYFGHLIRMDKNRAA